MAGGGLVGRAETANRAEQRVAVDLPTDLYKETKLLAVEQGTTVKEIIVSALGAEIARRRRSAS